MKTDELITLLANRAEPVDRAAAPRRYAFAVAAGASGAMLLLLARFGLKPDLAVALAAAPFWIKLAFPATVAAGALLMATRLARPGLRVGRRWIVAAMPIVAVWLGAVLTLASAPSTERLAMLLGTSWRSCPLAIAYLAAPGLAVALWAMKGMAPTRPRAAGAAAGLLAGALATVVYCFHCPEMEVAFWAVWYLVGMLLPALLGAVLGPRLLRW